MKKILFVCTGNTCRSPMAEALCRRGLKEKNLDEQFICDSAGIGAFDGAPATEEAIRVMDEIGLDISDHRAKRLTPDLLKESDDIYVMTAGHRDLLVEAYPEKKKAIRIVGNSISDPFGQSLQAYRDCRNILDGHIQNIIALYIQEMGETGYPL